MSQQHPPRSVNSPTHSCHTQIEREQLVTLIGSNRKFNDLESLFTDYNIMLVPCATIKAAEFTFALPRIRIQIMFYYILVLMMLIQYPLKSLQRPLPILTLKIKDKLQC